LLFVVVEKQEKKFRERNKKRKEKPGQKTTGSKKVEAEELHPSWAASKKAKIERSQVKFEGKKVTFDSDSD